MTESPVTYADMQRQIDTIVRILRTEGEVSAHDLWFEGISRAAARINDLRNPPYSLKLRTVRKPGQMAWYVLEEKPEHWPSPRRGRRFGRTKRNPELVVVPGSWTCRLCHVPARLSEEIAPISETFGKGYCSTCGMRRMFERS